MTLSYYHNEQLKRLQTMINEQRKNMGLPKLTKAQVMEEIISNISGQKTAFLGSVIINP
ncbi:hypothetical protein AB7W78_18895 [Providencia rettgeri]